eukprot:Skav227149  [mRNA]  locus=scaffold133:634232:636690:+ [translate_table: standard]
MVSCKLSTRSLWAMMTIHIDEGLRTGVAPCGLVVDIIKAFNVLNRSFLRSTFLRLGFSQVIVDTWFRALGSMRRQLLVQGTVHLPPDELALSVRGIPEGDPLSVVGMFLVCLVYSEVVVQHDGSLTPLTYADNWEILSTNVKSLIEALPVVEHFLRSCELPVSPAKCWLWSLTKSGRAQLRDQTLNDQPVPVQLQAVDLGADIAYGYRTPAAKRNSRVKVGHRRLQRARGLPGSTWQKARLIFGGIWPQALHACETPPVPKSVLKRLRTQAGRVASLSKSGVNPYLACSVGAVRCVDPGFHVLCSRLRFFRLLWRDFQIRGRLYWRVSQDRGGRAFNLATSPWSLVHDLLLSTWMDHVAMQLVHRKACSDLQTIDFHASQTWLRYPYREQCLLLVQLTGATFTRDCQAEIRGTEVLKSCPLCGALDSRLHRARDCPQLATLRGPLLRLLNGRELPDHTWAFGLWDEPPSLRDWQAYLTDIPFPVVQRGESHDWVCLFSDGSCLAPTKRHLRLAGGSVIRAHTNGSYEVLWQGLVPGLCQNSYRAELIALAVAVGSIWTGSTCLDNKSVVQIARRLLRHSPEAREAFLPADHWDLWYFFLRQAEDLEAGKVTVRWIKAHQDLRTLQGRDKILATFNAHADRLAKEVVATAARSRGYSTLFIEVDFQTEARFLLADFHVWAADRFVLETPLPSPGAFNAFGLGVQLQVTSLGRQVHPVFAQRLQDQLQRLVWYPGTSGGFRFAPTLALMWQFILDTHSLPPFWYDGAWRLADDEVANWFVVPSAPALYGSGL